MLLNKKIFTQIFTTFCASAILMSSVYAGGPSSWDELPFPDASCDVSTQMEISREALVDKHAVTKPQGIFPWPDVGGRVNINGIWLSQSRGSYAVLRQIEHEDSPSYGALHLQFYSACSHTLLAEGTRLLAAQDWESKSVEIKLKNQGLKGWSLSVQLSIHERRVDEVFVKDYLKISILEQSFGERDHFHMGRFQ